MSLLTESRFFSKINYNNDIETLLMVLITLVIFHRSSSCCDGIYLLNNEILCYSMFKSCKNRLTGKQAKREFAKFLTPGEF